MSLKGANSPTRGRKLRSTGTKARAHVSNGPNSYLFLDREGGIDLQAGNAALAVIDGIKPQNEVEAMLAAQIAVKR